MPFRSEAQRGYFHAALARGDISPKVVKEFDRASKGQRKLPYHVKKAKTKKTAHTGFMRGLSKGGY